MPSRESSLRNLERARANWRPPRPWRSSQEAREIKRYVWDWLRYCGRLKYSGRAVGRLLDVSHTHIEKLVREFVMNPNKGNWLEQAYGRPTVPQLRRAQEQTRQERARGLLRSPLRRWRRWRPEALAIIKKLQGD
jgi:hypothetical protein